MDALRNRFPFRLALPFLELWLCFSILWPIRAEIIWEVIHAIRPSSGSNVRLTLDELKSPRSKNPKAYLRDEQLEFIVPEESPEGVRRIEVARMRKVAPAMLNIPAGLVTLPYVIFSTSKRDWVPPGMTFEVWRALTWPAAGMFFWWVAGRGLEAIASARHQIIRPRVSMLELLVATPLGVFCGLMGLGIPLEVGSAYTWETAFLSAGGILWAVLCGIVSCAWFMQWRMRRSQEPQGVSV
jgi:hypothetical protein